VAWLWQILDPQRLSQFRNEMTEPTFWVSVGKIGWINTLLSGDNALVIALALPASDVEHDSGAEPAEEQKRFHPRM
jgi:hypothetical protein